MAKDLMIIFILNSINNTHKDNKIYVKFLWLSTPIVEYKGKENTNTKKKIQF